MTSHVKPERILVCGGRKNHDKYRVEKTLNSLLPFFAARFVIIQGGAPGIDSLAEDWALSRGYACITMNAPWRKHPAAAGPIRNGWMLDWCTPQLVVAFPGGSGTEHMKRIAREAGIPVYEG